MSCSQCELKRAKLLIKSRIATDCFNLRQIMIEFEYRWPGRFYIEYDIADRSQTIMQRNTVAPYTPEKVYTHVDPNGNDGNQGL